KLADLLVLERNPLEDIRATADIEMVMKGGVLYDGMTLDEYWPQRRPFGARPWLDEDAPRNDDRPLRSDLTATEVSMASDEEFVRSVQDQVRSDGDVSYRTLFGQYPV